MRKQLLCSVAAIAITAAIGGSSFAADLPLKARPPVVALPMTWTGFYIGGHLGWGEGRFDGFNDWNGDILPLDSKPSGIVGGMQIGQNWQFNTFVLGWEADLSAAGWNNQVLFPLNGGPTAAAIETHINLLATLRGRLGLAFDRTLLYVTGGLAYAQAKARVHYSSGKQSESSLNKYGTVFGGGAEWKYNPNLSFRGEALYYYFDRSVSFVNHDDSQRATVRLKDALVVRFGANYHF